MDDREHDDGDSSSSGSGSSYLPMDANANANASTTVVVQQHSDSKLKKRRRTNKQEQAILEALFASSRTPSQAAREKVCAEINMSMKKLQVWLQNRRQKEKKDAGKWKPAYDSTGATTTSTATVQQSTSVAGSVSASNNGGRTSPFSGASASASAIFSSSSPQLPSHAQAPLIHVQHAAQAAPVVLPSPSPSSACVDSKLRLPSIRTIIPPSPSQALTPNRLPGLQRSLSLPSVAALAGDAAHPLRAPMQPRSASYSQTGFVFPPPPPASATFTHGAPGSARAIFGQLSSRPKTAIHAPVPEPEKRKRRTVVAARPLWEGMTSDPVEPERPVTTMANERHQGEVSAEDEGFVASPTESLGSQASKFCKDRQSTTASLLTATTLSGKGTPARRNSVRMEDILGSAGRNASDRGPSTTAEAGAASVEAKGISSALASANAAGRKRTYSRTLSISHHPNGGLQRSASTGSLSEAAARVFAEMPSSPPVPAAPATQDPGSSPILPFTNGGKTQQTYNTAAATRPRIQARALSSAGMNFQNMLALPRPQLFRSRSFQDRTGNTPGTTLSSHHSNNTPTSLPISSARSRPSLGTPTFSAAAAGMRPTLAQAGSSASKRTRRTASSIAQHPNFAQFSDSSDMEEEPELSFATSSTSAASSILDVSLCPTEADVEDLQDREIGAVSVTKQGSVINIAGRGGSSVDIVVASASLKKQHESIRSSATTTSVRNILGPLKMGHSQGQSQPLASSAAGQGAGEALGKKKMVSQMERDAAAVLAGLGFGQ